MIVTLKRNGLQGLFLRLAWGPRRVTSNTRYGILDSAYPNKVTASHGLWIKWLRIGIADWMAFRWAIVLPPFKATARVSAQIKDLFPQAFNLQKVAISKFDIEALKATREILRSQKQFAEADKIRDQIIAYGDIVADKKTKEQK